MLDEAVAQRNNLIGYFAGVLSFKPASHPWTWKLCAIGETVGLFVALYWKAEFDRPRPSRISPKIMPPIDPPGHASFPSAHATQAHLIALLLSQVLPEQAWASYESNDPTPNGPVFRMAERIARNREVLGVHYPTDSAAGKYLAEKIHGKLKNTILPKILTDRGVDFIKEAWDEWHP